MSKTKAWNAVEGFEEGCNKERATSDHVLA